MNGLILEKVVNNSILLFDENSRKWFYAKMPEHFERKGMRKMDPKKFILEKINNHEYIYNISNFPYMLNMEFTLFWEDKPDITYKYKMTFHEAFPYTLENVIELNDVQMLNKILLSMNNKVNSFQQREKILEDIVEDYLDTVWDYDRKYLPGLWDKC